MATYENPELAKVPTNWARIGMYGGIGGLVGGIAGALISKDNKVTTGLIGFAMLALVGGLVGAFVYYGKGTQITDNLTGKTYYQK